MVPSSTTAPIVSPLPFPGGGVGASCRLFRPVSRTVDGTPLRSSSSTFPQNCVSADSIFPAGTHLLRLWVAKEEGKEMGRRPHLRNSSRCLAGNVRGSKPSVKREIKAEFTRSERKG